MGKALRAEIQARFLSKIGKNSACETYQLRSRAIAEGLCWGTANAVLDAALIAFKKTFTKGTALRFAVGSEKDQDTFTLQFTTAGGVAASTFLSGQHRE